MYTHRCIHYTIEWVEGLAHYTINFPRHLIIRGEGYHGTVKNIINRWLDANGYINQ